jgi:peptidoglycan hydrolase-like protein with peptidoglycan-binding domain
MTAHARKRTSANPEVAAAPSSVGPAAGASTGPAPQGAQTTGPFASDWLNAALTATFGGDVAGLSARTGDDQANADIGAHAHTSGRDMSFSSDVAVDGAAGSMDADSLAIVGEEVAHALAGGGAGVTALDAPGDPGEANAKASGKRFADWVRGGQRAPAPSLAPATGGRAEVHRNASGSTTWNGNPRLAIGSRGDAVRQLQVLLNAQGAGIVVDGEFGPQTQGAVIRFQTARGLVVDGVAGPQTAGALRGANGPAAFGPTVPTNTTQRLTGTPSLKIGASGATVRTLQTLLNQKGASLLVDGEFGAKTYDAVVAFQRANRLIVDGVVGPQTAECLHRADAVRIGGAPAQGSAPTTTTGGSGGGGGATAPAPAPTSGTRVTGNPALRRGSQGALVQELQRQLNTHGGNLLVDGDFGSKTDAAVRGFQQANGLIVDGVVGTQTAPVLYSPTARAIVAVTTPAPAPAAPGANADRKRNADPAGRLNDARVNPDVRRLALETIAAVQAQGLFPYVVETWRSHEAQNAAYERGNSLVRAGGSWHNYGLAVDIAFWNEEGTGPTWSPRNYNDWYKLGAAGKAAGFTRWGGDFQSLVDMVHFEYHPAYANGAAYGMMDTYNRDGLQAVWDRAT